MNRQELTDLVQMASRQEPMEPHTVETQVDTQFGVREEAQRELAGDRR